MMKHKCSECGNKYDEDQLWRKTTEYINCKVDATRMIKVGRPICIKCLEKDGHKCFIQPKQ